MSEEFINALKKYKNILIVIKGSPDPDVIASSYAVKCICEHLGIRAEIFSQQTISLNENEVFVNEINIPIKFGEYRQETDKFDAYTVLDHQSASVEGLTNNIPCAVHIDHHEPVEEDLEIDFKLIKKDVGSVSTILALYLRDLDLSIEEPEMSLISTALTFGIQVDTDQYSHAVKLDYEALHFLSKYSSSETINKISNAPLSKETVALLMEAINNQIFYKDWLMTGVGFISESNRDSIAIIADLLLKRKDAGTVVVFAAVNKMKGRGLALDASFRSAQKHLNLNDIIKDITTEGGARKYKGAYQIHIDYFINCPDKALLWEVIKLTTFEVLKKRRDGIYITGLRGVYKKFKKLFSS
jgi:nanoRNase/pAp phosphatase (c-di-AMP/oligoRNAs hydrolase)